MESPADSASACPAAILDDGTAVIRIGDNDLGAPSGESANLPLFRLVDDLGCARVDLDCQDLGFLSSVGLATLLTLHRKLRAAGGCLVLSNVRPHIHEIFVVTRLKALLEVRENKAG
jgi:anti-anti-sigma factor